MLIKFWGFFMGYFFHFWGGMFFMGLTFCQIFYILKGERIFQPLWWIKTKNAIYGEDSAKKCMEILNMSKSIFGTLQP